MREWAGGCGWVSRWVWVGQWMGAGGCVSQCMHVGLMSTSAATSSGGGMQARWWLGYWVPDMSVQCFKGWHLKLSAGGCAHSSSCP